MEKNSPDKPRSIKANALVCSVCCVECVEVEFDVEVEGVVLQNVKAMRCPACGEEMFTPEQSEAIRKRIIDAKKA